MITTCIAFVFLRAGVGTLRSDVQKWSVLTAVASCALNKRSAVIIVRTLEKLSASQAELHDNVDWITLALFCLCLCSPPIKWGE